MEQLDDTERSIFFVGVPLLIAVTLVLVWIVPSISTSARLISTALALLGAAYTIIAYHLRTRRNWPGLRYTTPLILVGIITTGLVVLGNQAPLGFLLYFPAIAISAIRSGRQIGIGAAVLSLLGYALTDWVNPTSSTPLYNIVFVGTNLLILGVLIGAVIDAERKLRYAAQERREREQKALRQLADVLVNASDLDATLNAAVDSVAQILGVDAAAIVLQEDGQIVVKKLTGLPTVFEGLDIPHEAFSISAATIAHGQPIAVSDFAQERGLSPWGTEQEPKLRAGLAVPMVREGKPRGAFAGFSLKPRAFSQDDVHLLSLIAAQTLTAIERKRAEIEVRKTLEELETKIAERTTELTQTNEKLQLERAERKRVEEALQQANEKLTGWVDELQHHSREITRLSEMSDLLQSCITAQEAYSVIAQSAQKLFPLGSGALYVIDPSLNLAELAAAWGDSVTELGKEVFEPNECCALRRGRLHVVGDPHDGLLCTHVKQPVVSGYMCVPMLAQGEALGMLHLSWAQAPRLSKAAEHISESEKQLALTVADQIGLALANLRLRETLHSQAICDPLTGLYNRRYMEEWLEREVHRAERNQSSIGIIMMDLDHFKKLNDTMGHDAGDGLLRELSTFLQTHIRGGDIACRYGGEEFMIILPEASLEQTRERAEQLHTEFKQLDLQRHYQSFGKVTFSLGVAVFPQHGSSTQAVMRAADFALYRAKETGRDRVVVSQAGNNGKVP
jgi:diguanylate cyclase (GGDEF)-like protein